MKRSTSVGRHRPPLRDIELLDQAFGRHADHGQRLVELVRHAGRHVAEMGDARGIEQADLGHAAVGVVDGDQHDIAQAAGFILDGIGGDLDDALGAVGAGPGCVRTRRLQAFGGGGGLPIVDRRGVDALEPQLGMGPPDHLGCGLAEDVEHVLVGENDAGVAVEHDDAGAGRLEHRVEALHLGGELLLALLLVGDVDADDHPAAARHVADIGAPPLAIRPVGVGDAAAVVVGDRLLGPRLPGLGVVRPSEMRGVDCHHLVDRLAARRARHAPGAGVARRLVGHDQPPVAVIFDEFHGHRVQRRREARPDGVGRITLAGGLARAVGEQEGEQRRPSPLLRRPSR